MEVPVIKTEKLTKRFGDFIAANEISFEVRKGEIFGFLGANGAGKNNGHAYALWVVHSIVRNGHCCWF